MLTRRRGARIQANGWRYGSRQRQTLFLAAWENLRAYRGSSSLQSWLIGIARNKVKDYYRACLREPEPLENAKEDFTMDGAAPEIDERLDKEVAHKKIREVVNKLPEKYRAILIWRYWNGCSLKSISHTDG